MLADEADLPLDPLTETPGRACTCGSIDFIPDLDVMDTWATSSLSPQIVGRWLDTNGEPGRDPLYAQVFPFSLRPQAHEIIRTWAFYTLVKSTYHFGQTPWQNVMISGWGIAGQGMGKISKSRGGGPMAPLEMIERYSADALRYWAASTSTGKDAIISEEKIQAGAKLVTKLWNVAGFAQRFFEDDAFVGADRHPILPTAERLTPADAWILARLQTVIHQATLSFEAYDYAGAKNAVEDFFWRDLADNYLEMCKLRLYDAAHPQRDGARYALYRVLQDTLKLFAPLLPYVTEEIYCQMFASDEKDSIHTSAWPQMDPSFADPDVEALGERLVEIATAVRRYKSERSLPLGSEIGVLQVLLVRKNDDTLRLSRGLEAAIPDLQGITRARRIEIFLEGPPGIETVPAGENLSILIQELA
jgi:valyl-tRNA synthetase